MISVIVCSRQDPAWTLHERNVRKCASSGAIEYLRIDNSYGQYGLCAAYNEGVRSAKGDILVFMHEDAFFMEAGWDSTLDAKFSDDTVGLVGIAGTQYLPPDPPAWVAGGRPFIRGKVIHETGGGESFHLTVFSWDKTDSEVVAVDGLFFAIRASLFGRIAFDETNFDGFHFYDLDICMQVRETHRCVVTPDLLVKHASGGSFGDEWLMYARRFRKKYRSRLPVSCAMNVPDPSRRIPFETFDLKGKIPRVTIA